MKKSETYQANGCVKRKFEIEIEDRNGAITGLQTRLMTCLVIISVRPTEIGDIAAGRGWVLVSTASGNAVDFGPENRFFFLPHVLVS